MSELYNRKEGVCGLSAGKPVRKDSVILRKMGEETVIYDKEHRSLHVLNPTALLIWEMCDGAHTLEDMQRAMSNEFKTSGGDDVPQDIAEVIRQFRKKGLLE